MQLLNIYTESNFFLQKLTELLKEDQAFKETSEFIETWTTDIKQNNSISGAFYKAENTNFFLPIAEYKTKLDDGLTFITMELIKLHELVHTMSLTLYGTLYDSSTAFQNILLINTQLRDIQLIHEFNDNELIFIDSLSNFYDICLSKYMSHAQDLKSGVFTINHLKKTISVMIGSDHGDVQGDPAKAKIALPHMYDMFTKTSEEPYFLERLAKTHEYIHLHDWPFTHNTGF